MTDPKQTPPLQTPEGTPGATETASPEEGRFCLKRSPLIEALIEVHFEDGQWDVTSPGIFHERIKDTYNGENKTQINFNFGFQIQPIQNQEELENITKTQTPIEIPIQKIFFFNQDRTKAIAIGPNRYSCHSMVPYEGWPLFSKRMLNSLSTAIEIVKTEKIKKIALRYINHIFFSLEDDLFQFLPNLPWAPVLSKRVGIVNLASQIRMKEADAPILLTQTFQAIPPQAQDATRFTVVLDLEVVWDSQIALGGLEELLGRLHTSLVELFRANITNELEERFNAG